MKLILEKRFDREHPLFTLTILFLSTLFVSLIVNFVFLHHKLSLLPSELRDNLLGNEETFVEPYLFEEILFIVHLELFYMMMVTLLLFLFLYRVVTKQKVLNTLLLGGFLLTNAMLLSLLLTGTYPPLFAAFFTVSTLLLHLLFGALILYCIAKLYHAK